MAHECRRSIIDRLTPPVPGGGPVAMASPEQDIRIVLVPRACFAQQCVIIEQGGGSKGACPPPKKTHLAIPPTPTRSERDRQTGKTGSGQADATDKPMTQTSERITQAKR